MILLALPAFFPPEPRSDALWDSSAKWLGINIAAGQFHEQQGRKLCAFDEAACKEKFARAMDLVAADAEGVDVGQAGGGELVPVGRPARRTMRQRKAQIASAGDYGLQKSGGSIVQYLRSRRKTAAQLGRDPL